MKKGLVLLLFALFASTVTLFAQDNTKVKKDRPTKEERVEMMTKRMSSELMLSDSQNEKFAPLYKKYLDEMQSLRPSEVQMGTNMDDKQRDKMIRDGFAHQRKMIDLKEKYYNEFSKFLTPSQAQKIVGPMNGPMDRAKMKGDKMKRPDDKMRRGDDRRKERNNMIKK